MSKIDDAELITFEDRYSFREWLKDYSQTRGGIWLLISKTKKIKTVSYIEALEEAICYGWTDSMFKGIDDMVYKRYFSPRGRTSPWSENNRKRAEDLIQRGLMQQPGYDLIAHSKKIGRWDFEWRVMVTDELRKQFIELLKPYPELLSTYLTLTHTVQDKFVRYYFTSKKEASFIYKFDKIKQWLRDNIKSDWGIY